jgi:hypothetical protein
MILHDWQMLLTFFERFDLNLIEPLVVVQFRSGVQTLVWIAGPN